MTTSKITVYTWGMMGGILLAFGYLLSGLQLSGYNPLLDAIGGGAPDDLLYSKIIRYGFQIPAGIFLFMFFLCVERLYPSDLLLRFGFRSLSYIFGFSIILTAVFPCDAGCADLTFALTVSQGVHLMTEMLANTLITALMLILAAGYRRTDFVQLSQITNWCSFIVIVAVIILYNDSTFVGLLQRIIKICFITFVISTATTLYNYKPFTAKRTNFD